MNGYEELVEAIREEGKYYNPPPIQIGIVMERGKVKLDTNILDTDDYYIDCNLRLDDKEKVYIHTGRTASGDYVTDSSHNGTMKEYKNNVLYEGDRVLVMKLSNKEHYVVIAKVVVPE